MNAASLRLDKFLWFARLARTRSAAARLCAGGKVGLRGTQALKPHHPVRIGDWLTLEQGRSIRRICVTSLAERRGNAAAASLLYDEPAPPQPIPVEAWISLFEDDLQPV
jgi:ribosome-associated heat shock protein Hsp15